MSETQTTPTASAAGPTSPPVITPADVEAIDASTVEAPISVSEKAIQMGKQALARRGTPKSGLRVGVRGGGCSGASYVIEFADRVRKKDLVYDFGGLLVVVDPKSLVYLKGAVLDYEVKLMEHGFKWRNPNEKKGCGCGSSFGI